MNEITPRQTDRQVRTFCLLVLTLIACGFALYALRPVLVPFVLALFFTYCLAQVIDWQTHYLRLPHGVARLATGVLGMAFLIAFAFFLAVAVGKMSHDFGSYREQLDQFTERIAKSVPLEKLGIKVDPETGQFLQIPEQAGATFISAVLSEITNLISQGAVVVIFVVFILIGHQPTRRSATGLLAEIEEQVKRFISQTIFFSALTGVLVATVLAVLGVRFAVVFGMLAFLLNFIPNIGAIIATLLPIPMIVLSPEMSTAAKVLAVAIPGALQIAIGTIVQPKVQGSTFNLHPVTVLMSLIFFGMIWGMVGAFLATPIAAVIKIVFDRIPPTRPFADLMAGKLQASSNAPRSTSTGPECRGPSESST